MGAADPRYMVMKEVKSQEMVAEAHRLNIEKNTLLHNCLGMRDGLLEQDKSPGLWGGSMRSVAAWAEAEAQCPSRIKLFFIDDFITDPAVAVASLARFVGVS